MKGSFRSVRGRSPIARLRGVTGAALAAVVMLSATFVLGAHDADAAYETGSYVIYSPLNTTRYVTSPPRYHDPAGSCPSTLWDSPSFDNPSVCHPAAGGDWAMDIDASPGNPVYIDISPQAIDGWPAGHQYRVVAGDVLQWDSSANGKYQIFGIHTWDPIGAKWENYGWIVLGHIDTFRYTSGTVIAGPTTGRSTTVVANVAPRGSWGPHVHLEVFTNAAYSRSYNWDGPRNNDDSSLDACSRGGGNALDCNPMTLSNDIEGYLGGLAAWFAQVDNPYYPDF